MRQQWHGHISAGAMQFIFVVLVPAKGSCDDSHVDFSFFNGPTEVQCAELDRVGPGLWLGHRVDIVAIVTIATRLAVAMPLVMF